MVGRGTFKRDCFPNIITARTMSWLPFYLSGRQSVDKAGAAKSPTAEEAGTTPAIILQ
jgi:hypothetical protein